MAGAYVDGDSLWGLIWSVRDEFLARIPYELDEARRPNSLRLVALDVLEGRTTDEQLDILRDLIDLNPALVVAGNRDETFEHADTPSDYILDLVSAVAAQVLGRDSALREEDQRRLALSAESVAELEEQ
jgi:hypothetical protein